MYPSLDEKFNTVISKNTFYFQNTEYEEFYEGHISSIAQNIFLLKNKIQTKGLNEIAELVRQFHEALKKQRKY